VVAMVAACSGVSAAAMVMAAGEMAGVIKMGSRTC
jgi:hypothetical protein